MAGTTDSTRQIERRHPGDPGALTNRLVVGGAYPPSRTNRLSTSRVSADGEHQPGRSASCAGGNSHRHGHARREQRRLRHREIDHRHRSNIRIATSRSCQLNHHTSQRGTANRCVKTGDHRIKRGVEDVLLLLLLLLLLPLSSSSSSTAACARINSGVINRGNSTCNARSVSGRRTASLNNSSKSSLATPLSRIAAVRACPARNALATTSGPGPRLNPQQRLTLRPLPHPHLSLRPTPATRILLRSRPS